MANKIAQIIFTVLVFLSLPTEKATAQIIKKLPGSWKVAFAITPFSEGGTVIYNADKINLVEQLQAPYRDLFPRYFEFGTYINYLPINRLSVNAGIELSYKNRPIYSSFPYAHDPGFATRYWVEKSNNIFATIPLSVNYNLVQKGRFNWWLGAGFVNSFLLYQQVTEPKHVNSDIQTTIYQNFLELSTTFELMKKNNTHNSWYFQPIIRYAIVDYYNNRKYDIGKYPNVFPQRTIGFTIGYRKGIWSK
jgi:hypothetical protein